MHGDWPASVKALTRNNAAPLLFCHRRLLGISNGFRYQLDLRMVAGQAGSGYCASHIGCWAAAAGDSGDARIPAARAVAGWWWRLSAATEQALNTAALEPQACAPSHPRLPACGNWAGSRHGSVRRHRRHGSLSTAPGCCQFSVLFASSSTVSGGIPLISTIQAKHFGFQCTGDIRRVVGLFGVTGETSWPYRATPPHMRGHGRCKAVVMRPPQQKPVIPSRGTRHHAPWPSSTQASRSAITGIRTFCNNIAHQIGDGVLARSP